jgi:hypothetical protein
LLGGRPGRPGKGVPVQRTAIALLAASIAAIAAGMALASSRFSATFHMTYLSREPGAPTGQVPLMTWTDPGAPAEVPKTIERIDLRFHPGTRFDTSALVRCRAPDDEIKSKGASACPDDSRLGTGHTKAVFSSGAGFTTDVTLFNARGQIIVLVTLAGTPVTEFRDRVKGRTITIKPALPPGVSLKRLRLRIDRHSKGSGAEQRTYMRNPESCPPSRKWTTVARFTYVDGSAQTLRSSSPCRRNRNA